MSLHRSLRKIKPAQLDHRAPSDVDQVPAMPPGRWIWSRSLVSGRPQQDRERIAAGGAHRASALPRFGGAV